MNDLTYISTVRASAARKALLEALAAYDAAGFPASEEIRGKLIAAAMHLSDFKGRAVGDTQEGPEDWFGVL
jgi:hypothetical protein